MIDKIFILNELKRYKNFHTDADFARFLEISAQSLAKWYARNTFNADIIVNKFPEINKVFLLTGEGEMLKNNSNLIIPEQTTHVPLLPLSAQAGSLDDFTRSVAMNDCEQIISPIRLVDFAVPVSGDSMQPEYPSGSKILVKRINADAFIEWGRCYVLDTLNGIVVKKIMPALSPDKVQCVSINPDYPPFDVDKSDIRAMYRVLMLLSEK